MLTAAVLSGVGWLIWHGASALDYQWRWGRLPRYFLRQTTDGWAAGPLLEGLGMTMQLSVVAGLAAVVIGGLTAIGAAGRMPSLRLLLRGYVNVMRGTPLLVQLYLLYFMLGGVLNTDRFVTGALVLALFEGAFAAEIFRAGIASVPHGQTEAAAALGLRAPTRWRLIVLPQALPLMLPPLANLFVSLIKHSSIVTIIAIADLTDTARNLAAETFLTFEIWLTVGAMYVMICFPLARLISSWEARLRQRAKIDGMGRR